VQTATTAAADTDLALTNVPTDITVNANNPAAAVVTYTPPTLVDEAGTGETQLPVDCTMASQSVFPIGTTFVTSSRLVTRCGSVRSAPGGWWSGRPALAARCFQ
jgi:hypothetical protein